MKRKLGEICRIVSGSTPKTGIPEYWDGNLKWITPAELDDKSRTVNDTKRTITELGAIKTGLTPLPAGTVLLSSRAPIGKVAITGCEMYCNQGFKNLICSDLINNEYLYWFLKGKTQCLKSLGRGATFKEISKTIVADIEINLPDIEEQEKIVNCIKKIDSRLFMLRAEISRLDELIKARFVEMFGDNFGEIVELGNVCDVRDGTHDSPKYHNEGYPLVTSKNICNGKIDFSTCNLIQKEDYDKINKRSKVEIGDILMPMIGTVGNPIIINTNNEFAIKNVALIKFKDNSVILNTFVKALLESDYFGRAVLSKTKGGTQKFISLGDIRKLELNLPPIELQNQFAAFVAQVDKSKFTLSNELAMGNFYIRLIHDCIMHGCIDLRVPQ